MSTISNPPGQAALSYRARTYATSLASMLANLRAFAIPSGPNQGSRPLAKLTTRAGDDPTIALLDAWAMVVDVLTFYQERIANEGYLRTATERISLIELTGAVGFQLDPGLAATTALAFVVEGAAGTPGTASIPVGTQVQSVPAQGQLPQVFETTAPISARAEWNALRPQQSQLQRLAKPGDPITTPSTITFAGTSLALQPGALLWVQGENKAVHVAQATTDLTAGTTTVQLFQGEGVQIAAPPAVPPPSPPAASWIDPVTGSLVSPSNTPLNPTNVQAWILAYRWKAPDLALFMRQVAWDEGAVADILAALTAPAGGDALTAFGLSLGFFGRNDTSGSSTPIWQAGGPPDVLLERQAPGIATGTTMVLVDTTHKTTLPVKGYTVTSVGDQLVQPPPPPKPTVAQGQPTPPNPPPLPLIQVTGLGVSGAGSPAFPAVGTIAYLQSRPIPLAPTVPFPLSTQLGAGSVSVTLDHTALGLMPGQLVALTGQRVDTGVMETEVLTLSMVEQEGVQHAGGTTTLTFTAPLANTYALSTVTLNANVAPATHGQTVAGEVLGSGDGSQENQTFVLAKPNLTYVPPVTARGGTDTLTVLVNGVPWQEVPSLFGQGGQSRSYMVRNDDQGRTSVVFGDGVAGARLPTGQENVTATYRNGLGPNGNVAAGALTLLFTRPLGVRTVQNPLPATGGAAPQALDDARAAAPLTVRTLGRIVTLTDYADFAADFPGVGKAQATQLESLGTPVAHLTVAPAGGVTLADPTGFLALIQSSIAAIVDPSQESIVDLCNTRYFGVNAVLVLQGGADFNTVSAAATAALEAAFGFAARSFAQSVHAAEVVVVLQGVPGVLGVELTPLTFTDGTGNGSVLLANPARWDPTSPTGHVGADLILVSPNDISLKPGP